MLKCDTLTKKYEKYTIPETWNCHTKASVNTKINCANCGKEVEFHNSFISHEIINENTRKGFPVCELCRIKEIYNNSTK